MNLARAIARSSEDFVALAEAMPHLVWVAAPDGRIVYVNARWIEYTGKDVAQMATRGRKEIVHTDDVTRTWEQWNAALGRKEPYEIEYRLRRQSDGAFRWFIGRAIPVIGSDGTISRWVGTATDIDTQRRATENLRFVLECSNALANLRDVSQICHRLAQIAIERFAERCVVALADGSTLGHADDDDARLSEQHADAIARVIDTNTPLLTAQEGATLPEQSVMIVPISSGGPRHRALGALLLFSPETQHCFDRDDLSSAEIVARQAASSIANALAFERERRTATLLRFLSEASELLTKTFDVQAAIGAILDLAVGEIADVAFVWNAHGDALRIGAVSASDPEVRAAFAQLVGERPLRHDAETALLRHFATGHPSIVDSWPPPDFAPPALYEYAYAIFGSLSIASLLSIPLKVNGEPVGALVFMRHNKSLQFQPDEREILSDVARRVTLAYGQASLFARERHISTELQRAMLPRPEMMPKVPGITFDVFYHPSSSDVEVGGDWYDALALPDGSVVISVGDVTGRGLNAAGLMGKLRQALGVVALYERDPARMLDAVDVLLRQRGSGSIATAFIGVIDPDARTMRYANAGHPYPMLRRDGRVITLESHGLPLGLRDQGRAESVRASLRGAQALVLYTDGLVEATHDFIRGERLLKSIVARNAMLFVKSPAKMLCDACLPDRAPDDAAVLVLQFSDQPRWHFDAENARAAHDARSGFVTYLREHGCIGDLNAAEIIFGELCGNVVRHAPGPIDVNVDWRGIRAVLHVTDRGRGFDRKPSLPDDMMKESGRGLYIVEALSRGFATEYVPGYGSHVWAELPVERTARKIHSASKPVRQAAPI